MSSKLQDNSARTHAIRTPIIRWERTITIDDMDSTHFNRRVEIAHLEPARGEGWERVEIPRGLFFDALKRETW